MRPSGRRWRSSPLQRPHPRVLPGGPAPVLGVDHLRRGAATAATRAHLELYRAWMEERRLAAATIDRRLSTVCGYYRFAHLDGRIATNPARHVRRPQVHPSTHRGLDRGELAAFLYSAERVSPAHAALAVLLGLNGLRVSEACGANVEDLGIERGHRTLRIVGKGNQPATIPLVPRTARTVDLRWANAPRDRSFSVTTAAGSIPAQPTAGSVRSVNGPAGSRPPAHAAAAFIMAALDRACRSATCNWPPATPTTDHHHLRPAPAEPRPTRRLRRRRLRRQRLTNDDHQSTTEQRPR